MTTAAPVTVFGEVLFDRFPDGTAVPGGAPFNVAWNLRALGLEPRFVSRVGRDAAGDRIVDAMRGWGLATGHVQRDDRRPTGTVNVTVENGEPRYDIAADQAYDHIQIDAAAAAPGGLLYHGTLALRHAVSRRALEILRPGARVMVDVNLREPWWHRAQVLDDLREAGWAKLNAAELRRLTAGGRTDDERARTLVATCGLEGLVVTRGDSGASWYAADAGPLHVPAASGGAVADTVGAGDAFAAVVLLGLAREWDRPLILERAAEFAAAVVALHGATTEDRSFYEPFKRKWLG